MAAKKRTRGEREHDLVLVSRLYLQGHSHQAIAEMLNIKRPYELSRSQISRDIDTIHKRWQQAYLLDFNEAQVRELARLDHLEAEYWRAYERSQEDAVTVQEVDINDEMSGNKSYKRKKRITKAEKQTGRESYLQGVQWCIEQRCKILGLHAPKKYQVDWREEARLQGIDPDELHATLVEQFIQAAEKGANPPPKTSLGDNN